MAKEAWAHGDAYEAYVGRWSRGVAKEFLSWLDRPSGLSWLDVGCGTGALTATVLRTAQPIRVVGIDPSDGFLALARAQVTDSRAEFHNGDAQSIPLSDNSFEAVISGLVLNFVPDQRRAAAEIYRVTTPGGLAAAYVWDYAEGMQMMRYAWDAAATLNPDDASIDEKTRFPLCQPEPLRALWTEAGFDAVAVRAIEIPTVFADFDDFWRPFLGGQGPAPAYVMSLPEEDRTALRELLRQRLPIGADGSISLIARAWAVRGNKEE